MLLYLNQHFISIVVSKIYICFCVFTACSRNSRSGAIAVVAGGSFGNAPSQAIDRTPQRPQQLISTCTCVHASFITNGKCYCSSSYWIKSGSICSTSIVAVSQLLVGMSSVICNNCWYGYNGVHSPSLSRVISAGHVIVGAWLSFGYCKVTINRVSIAVCHHKKKPLWFTE
jgi:hypothetical protein